jgi:phosphoesterase RecJ-like protein
MIDIDELDRVAELIEEAPELVMACHIGPDGDALGSMLGMALAAVAAGKRATPSFGEPHVVPDTYRFLPTDLLVKPSAVPSRPAVFISFDAGSIDRLGELAGPATSAESLIVIDHHATNEGFGTHNLVIPTAAATAEIVVALLDRLGWEISEDVATCLHTAIVTDTGRFQYSNTSPETLRTAARLLEAGARPEIIGQHVYEETPFGYLSVAGAVMARAEIDAELGLVWSILRQSDLESSEIGMDDTDPLIDTVRVAREADVALLVKELGDSKVKGSLRSRGRVDVGSIASELGGGGHHNAAGFTFEGDASGAIAAVKARLEPRP